MKPTPKQEAVLLSLTKHYEAKKRPPLWYVKRDNLWKALLKPTLDEANTKHQAEKDACLKMIETVVSNQYKDSMRYHKLKRVYINHLNRLQDQCKILSEVVAEERKNRNLIDKASGCFGYRLGWTKGVWKEVRTWWSK